MTGQLPNPGPGDAIDLTNCDREPIHLLGGVQGYGCLIATSADFMVNHVSENVQDLLDITPDAAIGARLSDLLPEKTIHDLRTKLQVLNSETTSSRLFGYDVRGNGDLFDVSVHALNQNYVFEFEPKIHKTDRDEMSLVQPLVARVRRADDIKSACDQAAMALQVMSGFDRVMVYRFDHDGTGEVISERRKSHMEPFLGLRYPASDIPKQARALFLRTPLRFIADVDGLVSQIVPTTNVQGAPIDLSLAVTRAVSPIHLEYLRNMGVAASMSVSIVKDGQLWGLFACHHNTPRHVDFERRTAIELFAQLFAYELSQKIEREARVQNEDVRQMQDALMLKLSHGTSLIDGFEFIHEELAGLIKHDGIAVFSDGKYKSTGEAPDASEYVSLVRFLNTAPAGQIYTTHHLSDVYPNAEDITADVAGVLAIPISRTPRDYILFFRRKIAKSVTWAGNPDKPVEVGPNGIRLTPRKSFEAWSEIVRNTSTHWTKTEIQTAESLRISLIEVVLKLTDEANESRRKAAATQELLIAELNHRVRNILNLIHGLISQSSNGARDVATYTKVLDGRVQALARAHDQLTRQEWAPSSLRKLIDVEISAFQSDAKECVTITGDSPTLMPNAFSTMALVIHEMVTNSAKYGALSTRSGKVLIDLKVGDHGDLLIAWREIGGPPVQAPVRQGFGTTIIEKTIPYELNGTVNTRYALTGFQADIMLPSASISHNHDEAENDHQAAEVQEKPVRAQLTGEVLIVEDNMVIALDASDMLSTLGAETVHMASTVDEALQVITQNNISFAVLDVNLGNETSLPIANYLAKHNIPYLLGTGYGDAKSITSGYPSSIAVSKPFSVETLSKAIDQSFMNELD